MRDQAEASNGHTDDGAVPEPVEDERSSINVLRPDPEPVAADSDRHRRGRQVLIVDRDAGQAQRIRDALAGHEGYVLEHVATIAEATEALSTHGYHAVLLGLADVQPDEGALAEALAAGGTVPVVVVIRGADGARLLEAGADDYLDPDELGPALLRRSIDYAVARARARELRRRLEHADRLAVIGQLAAGVAHEVNNPAAFVLMNLRSCRQYLEDLREAGTDRVVPSDLPQICDDMLEMIEENRRGVERIVEIVGALRQYARLERDEVQAVDVAVSVREACGLVANAIRHRAKLRVELGSAPTVACDPRKLVQVLINLLMNAADSIAEGHASDNQIRIQTLARGREVVIAVVDSGAGIPPAIRDRIFEPFFSTKPREKGTGLGLSIASDIVGRFGGRIVCESQVGVGSRFEVILPADDRPLVIDPATGPLPAVVRARVLVVDDEVSLTTALARQLQRHHDVTVANDGHAALAAIERIRFDVIICDLMMPGMDGVAVYQAISARDLRLAERVIFLTGGAFGDRAQSFIESVPRPCLYKPVRLTQLLGAIEDARRRQS